MTKAELLEKLQVTMVATTNDGSPWGYRHGQPDAASNATHRWGRRSYTIKIWYNSKYPLTVNDCLDQLFGDATAGEIDGVYEFMREFSYQDRGEAERVYRACARHYKKVVHLFDDDYDLYRAAAEAYYE